MEFAERLVTLACLSSNVKQASYSALMQILFNVPSEKAKRA
jgi:hypothetical protein